MKFVEAKSHTIKKYKRILEKVEKNKLMKKLELKDELDAICELCTYLNKIDRRCPLITSKICGICEDIGNSSDFLFNKIQNLTYQNLEGEFLTIKEKELFVRYVKKMLKFLKDFKI